MARLWVTEDVSRAFQSPGTTMSTQASPTALMPPISTQWGDTVKDIPDEPILPPLPLLRTDSQASRTQTI